MAIQRPHIDTFFSRVAVRPQRSVAFLVVAGVLIRLAIAVSTEGTNDVDTWLAFIDAARTHGAFGLYGVTDWTTVPVFHFNHGPLTAMGIQLAVWVQDTMPIGDRLLPRLPAIVADAGATVLAYRLVTRRAGSGRGLVSAAMIALNPALILVSAFHGNTDTVFAALLLVAIVLLDEKKGGLAGIAFAASMAVKIVPVVAGPALLLSIGSGAVRRRFFWSSVATSSLFWLPTLLNDPVSVFRQVFLYNGLSGVWGIDRAAAQLGLNLDGAGVPQFWRLGLLVAIVASAFKLAATHKQSAEWSVAATFVVFLAVSHGFGVQYLAWPVMFLVVAAPRLGAVYSAVAGVVLYVTYAMWTGDGWMIDYANTWSDPPMSSARVGLLRTIWQMMWVLVVWVVYVLHRRPTDPRPSPRRARSVVRAESPPPPAATPHSARQVHFRL